jgi:hypothetical protein
VFSQRVRPLGAAKLVTLDENLFARAKWYVLSNCKDTDSYLKCSDRDFLSLLYVYSCHKMTANILFQIYMQ